MAQKIVRAATSLLLATTLLFTGCSIGGDQAAGSESSSEGGQQQSGGQAGGKVSYPDIKAMVLDILHSKEGMSTLKDTISSPDFKRQAAISEADISAAVEKAFNQGHNKSFLAEQMKDPQFAAAVVKSARPQMVEIQKQLMKDPEYQKQLLSLMASPEYQQTQLQLLKSPEYRKEIMKIMTEALQEPTFRLLFMDSMKEAVKSAGGGNPKQMGQKQQEGGQSKGESKGGGGGGGGSGGGDSGEGSEGGGD
ncbi:spore germination lipoprotein GerD [Sulfoacidibacillus thermotolerans]|uniref:Spore germination GerD central core domain-containing protein n=1 Tax=Sulfoacidibacillus thermotolerans TaxID=1765684 RepID=A0A2U3DBL8_SULT2|nr:spore germination lipoprotein GerD [Sulfoacidibacillus thermotolerans]PWI58652.1 hypothetical protein BM613_00700 [Sulfoacidibacillus thermotolerans]